MAVKKSKSRSGKPAAATRKAAAKRAPTRSAEKTASRKVAKRAAKPALSDKAKLARNKKAVLAFYDFAINKKDFVNARKYLGDRYVQHNPGALDGFEALQAWLEEFKGIFPDLRVEVKRVIAEGDFVVLHVHGVNGPAPHGAAIVDIFRLEEGKVVEHWDVIQDIPATAVNDNGMF